MDTERIIWDKGDIGIAIEELHIADVKKHGSNIGDMCEFNGCKAGYNFYCDNFRGYSRRFRRATPDEIKAYHSGIRNIKDMVQNEYGFDESSDECIGAPCGGDELPDLSPLMEYAIGEFGGKSEALIEKLNLTDEEVEKVLRIGLKTVLEAYIEEE